MISSCKKVSITYHRQKESEREREREKEKVFQRNNIYVYKSKIIKLLVEKKKKVFCIYKVVRKINLSDGKEHAYVD